MRLCDGELCTGCMACLNICPVEAITIVSDEEGFEHPQINQDKCIKCYRCSRTCPQISEKQESVTFKKVYAMWSKNPSVRQKSTSGGAFTEIAKLILLDGGIVFGASFLDENVKKVGHICINEENDLSKLRGSKYVQSHIGDIYKTVLKALKTNKKVLFSGTPCQVAGLYAYLGNRYENLLYTIDFVCHGVPSPKIWYDYVSYMENKYSSKIISASFRTKKESWFVFRMELLFESGKKYSDNTYKDPYIRGFLRNLYLRPSCHQCKYASTNRVADITLADFWGYQPNNKDDIDDDKGISMLMINTLNGQMIFSSLIDSDSIFIREHSLDEAVKGNQSLHRCYPPSTQRENFWKDYGEKSFQEIINDYFYPEKVPSYAINRYINIHLSWLPNLLKTLIGKFFSCFDVLYK